MTVDVCIKQFKDLCKEAFKPREMIGIPLLEKFAILNHGSMYKTAPFEAVLKERLGMDPLFGGNTNKNEMVTKVAVTSTTTVDQHAVVLTNYNRPDPTDYGEYLPTYLPWPLPAARLVYNKLIYFILPPDLPYTFERSDGPATEFKIWEAYVS